uniref:C-type lectin domain-containing protein n=1 Tax=Poecilia reticulata TaxID=8081 RepID=A0A3P9NJ76_POERE
ILLLFSLLLYLTRLKCEAGWEPHGGNCYYFNTNKSSWTDSRRSCVGQKSDLVKIDSREEQSRLRGLMEDDEDKFWIGLTDSGEEDEWLWVDGSALDQRFVGCEDTLVCLKNSCWYDRGCDYPQKSICEKTCLSCWRPMKVLKI